MDAEQKTYKSLAPMNKVIRLFGMTSYMFIGSLIMLVLIYFISQSIILAALGVAILLYFIKIRSAKHKNKDYLHYANKRNYNSNSKRITDDLNILKHIEIHE